MGFDSEARFVPGRRVWALAIVVVAVIVAVLVYRATPNEPEPAVALGTDTETSRNTLTETDADGDGLKDWEESLFGFDPTLADSDGDGTNDADELAALRAEQEARAAGLLADAEIDLGEQDPSLTKTDILARSLLDEVFAFQDAGISIDSSTAGSVAEKLVSSLSTGTGIKPPSVKLDELNVVDETEASLRAYGNALGAVIGGTPTIETNELLVFAELGRSSDPTTFEKLSTVKESYRRMVHDMTNIPVPDTLVTAHVAFLNGMLATSETFDLLATLGDDPLQAVMGLQLYVSYSRKMTDAFAVIGEHLRDNVVFNESETGYSIVAEESAP